MNDGSSDDSKGIDDDVKQYQILDKNAENSSSFDEDDLLIEYESIFNEKDQLEEAISFSYHIDKDTLKPFHLSTLLFPDNLAPIFSGCEWAGTRLWKASIRGIEYLHRNHLSTIQNNNNNNGNGCTTTLLELGCGLGIPGMVARCLGAKCVVTDQSNLLSQLDNNIQHNFTKDEIDNKLIQAKELSWSKDNIHSLLSELNYDKTGFDIVLNCDCIYEPLYGKSYELLLDVIDELLIINPKCIVITSVERRYSDAIDVFLSMMEQLNSVSKVEKVCVHDKHRIQIYRTYGIC